MGINERETFFKDLIKQKFGDGIYKNLCSDDLSLKPENLNLQEDYKKAVNDQIMHLSAKYFNSKLSKSLQWAFDFPGWLGKLDFNKENVKDIMIVGLEPHIIDRYYNIAYGLFEDSGCPKIKKAGEDFKIELSDRAKDYRKSASRFWEIMLSVFANEETLKEIKSGNGEVLIRELNRFYCTDLCYFTVQGDTSAIRQVPGWGNIRKIAASTFLFSEIKYIKPKLVVMQGGAGIFLFSEMLFNNMNPETFNSKYRIENKYKNIPCYYRSDHNVLFIPHSSTQNGDFWRKHLKGLRSDFITLWPDIYS